MTVFILRVLGNSILMAFLDPRCYDIHNDATTYVYHCRRYMIVLTVTTVLAIL